MHLLTRRHLLQSAAAGAAALALPRLSLLAKDGPKGYTLPKLPYAIDALEPHIDAKTMEIHHDAHHKAYIDKANELLADHPKLLAMPVEQLLANIKEVPEKIRQGVINQAGGHANHTLFWEIMGPKSGKPDADLANAIAKAFKNIDEFKKMFSQSAVSQFGAGWAWLVVNGEKKLEIVQRKNQDSPLIDGLKPVLGIDVWEHAYYLKYRNKRADYIKAWWNVVNWEAVGEKYRKAIEAKG